MQLFEALTLMAGIYLPDGRPLAEELDRVCAGDDYSRNVVFKDGSYIKIMFFGLYYEPGTSTKTLVSPNIYVFATLSNNAEAFRELCIKVAKIY